MNKFRASAIIFGVFFIIAFLSYGTGSALIAAATDTPDFLMVIQGSSTYIIIGLSLFLIIKGFSKSALKSIAIN